MYGVTRAPEIDRAGLTWFNVDKPLALADLRGRLVILDFWTFCCINCIHVVPTLRRIEETYPDAVVVIGVHSPKFAAERDPRNVAATIERYGIRHPVVHDPGMTIWSDYAIRAWPTLVFISPDGHLVGQLAGEPDPELIVRGVGDMLHDWMRRGVLSPAPFALAPPATDTGGHLRFPGKIKPVPGGPGRRWALADSGHHQIVLLDDEGVELARFGDGEAGWVDGPDGAARFNAPQGLVCTSETIFVADTGNHAIRRVDLASGRTSTLAGNGARGLALERAAPAGRAMLASVWDLELKGERLFFANAGTHQVGVLDLKAGTVAALAGTGGENIVDGPAASALLAQPSGLALSPDHRTLYVADSETSSIRAIALDSVPPAVSTLVGRGLFEFGHADGPFEAARLQHPLGIACTDGWVFVADSYNDAVRTLDLKKRLVRDLDDGFTCSDPICLPLSEPAGIAVDGPERLLVVDSNNHRVVEYRIPERHRRTWLE